MSLEQTTESEKPMTRRQILARLAGIGLVAVSKIVMAEEKTLRKSDDGRPVHFRKELSKLVSGDVKAYDIEILGYWPSKKPIVRTCSVSEPEEVPRYLGTIHLTGDNKDLALLFVESRNAPKKGKRQERNQPLARTRFMLISTKNKGKIEYDLNELVDVSKTAYQIYVEDSKKARPIGFIYPSGYLKDHSLILKPNNGAPAKDKKEKPRPYRPKAKFKLL